MTARRRLVAAAALLLGLGAAQSRAARACRIDGLPHELLCGSLAGRSTRRGPRPRVSSCTTSSCPRWRGASCPTGIPARRRARPERDRARAFADAGIRAPEQPPRHRLRRPARHRPLGAARLRQAGRAATGRAADTGKRCSALARCRERFGAPSVKAAGLGLYDDAGDAGSRRGARALGAERINLVGASTARAPRSGTSASSARGAAQRCSTACAARTWCPASAGVDAQAALDALFSAAPPSRTCAPVAGTAPDLDKPARFAAAQASGGRPLTGPQRKLHADARHRAGRGAPPLYAGAGLGAAGSDQAAARGRVEALVALGTSLARRGAPGLSTGMHFSVICAEDVPPRA